MPEAIKIPSAILLTPILIFIYPNFSLICIHLTSTDPSNILGAIFELDDSLTC